MVPLCVTPIAARGLERRPDRSLHRAEVFPKELHHVGHVLGLCAGDADNHDRGLRDKARFLTARGHGANSDRAYNPQPHHLPLIPRRDDSIQEGHGFD